MRDLNTAAGRWAAESRECLLAFADALEVERSVVDADPPRLLPYLDTFVESLPFDELDEDDWIWLTTSTAAFLGEAILDTGRARWDAVESASGRVVPVLRVRGHDGQEHVVAPFEYASTELRKRPPVFTRALAGMRIQAGLAPDVDNDDTAWTSAARRIE